MKPVTIPSPPSPENDPGIFDVNEKTWPDPETVRLARAAIKSGEHLRRPFDEVKE
ncbi:hypothetical protein [Pseudoxanthomonas dokdonensis]|uniref:hypothetical protein n=1 Tax=Pseudoxanthomonas dokdonensis TaxID=344882 RepID=UPI000A6EFF15|nr:hypothetical protein [Pseudoxanthomonas dokdonensis]